MLGQPRLHADPAGGRLQAHRRAAGGRDRHRPRAHRHPDAAQEGRRRQVRRVLRPGPRRPAAGRPRHHRQHGARVRRDLRLLPRRRTRRSTTCASPAAPESRSRSSRPTARSRASSTPPTRPTPSFTDTLELDLGHRRAEPRRPHAPAGPRAASRDVEDARSSRQLGDDAAAGRRQGEGRAPGPRSRRRHRRGGAVADARAPSCRRPRPTTLDHGSVVIAAITSCTNTSNPSVMLAAGLLAKKAVERGLHSQALGQDQPRPRLQGRHRLPRRGRPHCRTSSSSASTSSATAAPPASATAARCPTTISEGDRRRRPRRRRRALRQPQLRGPHQPEVRANYLASPPLVVAYALAGTIDIDLDHRAARHRQATASRSTSRHLADRSRRSHETIAALVSPSMFRKQYADVFDGDEQLADASTCPPGDTLRTGTPTSTYVQQPPFFDGMTARARAARPTSTARACWRVLRRLASPPTTSRPPARSRRQPRRQVPASSTASRPQDFNTYGARRGNHEVMVRGTFANIRLTNLLVPGIEGGVTAPPARRRADVDLRRRR